MNTSPVGIELIAEEETYSPTAYYDAGGFYSIGYGTLIDSTEEQYLRGATISEQTAKKLLYRDVEKIEKVINKRSPKLNQNQFDALISFGYNLGTGPVITMVNRLNSGWSADSVADKMLLYTKSEGVTLPGLVTRRKKEVKLFLTPVTTKQALIQKVSVINGGVATSVTILLVIAMAVAYKLFYLKR